MQTEVESTDRGPADYIAFAITFAGNIIALAGVVTTTASAAIFGLILMLLGSIYLALTEKY
jgi:hypothetical protein